MVQPIDNASVLEGTAPSQLGLIVQSLPYSTVESWLPSSPLRESYLISNPWIAESSTAVSNQDARATLAGQRETIPSPLVTPLLIDVSRRIVKVQALQRWTGRVERVTANRFVAITSDVTSPTRPAEEVELDLEDVSPADRSLVAEGAIFYWAIVYRDTKGGQRERITTIRFARQPKLSDEEIKDIFSEADELANLLESA